MLARDKEKERVEAQMGVSIGGKKMNNFHFSMRSLLNLSGVHGDLIRVCMLALQTTPIDFVVVSGVRTLEEQKALVESGKSKTMKSRHLFGLAVDLYPIVKDKDNLKDTTPGGPWAVLADHVKEAGNRLSVPVWWGMDLWGWDCPHFEIPRTGNYANAEPQI